MLPAADPVSLIAALVVLFGIGAVVWLMIAAGLRESPGACACLSGANAALGASFLLHEALGLVSPQHYWWSDLLSLIAFALIRLAVPGVLSTLSSGGPRVMKTSPRSVRHPGTPSSLNRWFAALTRPKY